MKDKWIKRLNHYEIKKIEFGERLVKDEEFEAFANNPSLETWYKELPRSKEKDLLQLRKMFSFLIIKTGINKNLWRLTLWQHSHLF